MTSKKGGPNQERGSKSGSLVEMSNPQSSQRGSFRPKRSPRGGPFQVLGDARGAGLAGHPVFMQHGSGAALELFWLVAAVAGTVAGSVDGEIVAPSNGKKLDLNSVDSQRFNCQDYEVVVRIDDQYYGNAYVANVDRERILTTGLMTNVKRAQSAVTTMAGDAVDADSIPCRSAQEALKDVGKRKDFEVA